MPQLKRSYDLAVTAPGGRSATETDTRKRRAIRRARALAKERGAGASCEVHMQEWTTAGDASSRVLIYQAHIDDSGRVVPEEL